MLIQFTIENHRSIKRSAVVSFAASKDKSLEEYLLHPDTKQYCFLRLQSMEQMLQERAMYCTRCAQ